MGRTESVIVKGVWKRGKRNKRIYSREGSDTSIPGVRGRLGSRFHWLVKVRPYRSLEEVILTIISAQGLSTKPNGGLPDSNLDHKGPAVGPDEDIQEAKRGHDPNPGGRAQDDGEEVLILCCYFSRTNRPDQLE